MVLERISNRLAGSGLILRGGFATRPEDRLPTLSGGGAPSSLVLLGNAGPALWTAFAAAPEIADGLPHPLNRWTRRLVDEVAAEAGATPLYPFDTEPAWPFQRWAMRAEPVHPSPIGLLIHPEFGLWHAYRAALLLGEAVAFPEAAAGPSPCESCRDRPCLSTCPVGAFAPGHYDVPRCLNHLEAPRGEDCLEQGCRARRACPVGVAYRSPPAQAGFHMRAFLAAGRARRH